MSGSSDADAYSYAKFLVDIFPESAIEILHDRAICDLKKIEERVDKACIKLGPLFKIKGHVQNREFDKLFDLNSAVCNKYPSPTTPIMTPNVNMRGPLSCRVTGLPTPSTPSSMASGALQSQRVPSHEDILIHHGLEKFPLSARASGSEAYFIGEDKLERFDGLSPSWVSTPEKVVLGGNVIEVAQYVQLTWSRSKDPATDHKLFWVAPPGQIRHADVLLGYGKRRSRGEENRGRFGGGGWSPLSLNSQTPRMPPTGPTPPSYPSFYPAHSSTDIYSRADGSPSSVHCHPVQSPNNANTIPTNHHQPAPASTPAPPPPFARPATTMSMTSGFPPSACSSSQLRDPLSSSPPTPGGPGRPDTVIINLSFKSRGRKLLILDLSKPAQDILLVLSAPILKLSGGEPLSRSEHEMKVTPLRDGGVEPQTCALGEGEFDYLWGAVVDYIKDNRKPGLAGSAEFAVDIG